MIKKDCLLIGKKARYKGVRKTLDLEHFSPGQIGTRKNDTRSNEPQKTSPTKISIWAIGFFTQYLKSYSSILFQIKYPALNRLDYAGIIEDEMIIAFQFVQYHQRILCKRLTRQQGPRTNVS